MDTHFNINRFLLILKRDLYENYKTAFLGILTILSVFSFILIMTTFDTNQEILNAFSSKIYIIQFFIVGLFFSGMAFKDFRNKEKTMSFLMIPTSSTEKVLSTLLLTTVGFIISFTVLFSIFNLLNMLIIEAIPGNLELAFYNPFNNDVWTAIKVFLPIQAIFLAGAATFKRMPIFYTALSTFLVGLVFTFILIFVSKFLAEDLFQFASIDGSNSFNFNIDNGNMPEFKLFSIEVLKFFFSYILAPIFWLVAWFKINEKEV